MLWCNNWPVDSLTLFFFCLSLQRRQSRCVVPHRWLMEYRRGELHQGGALCLWHDWRFWCHWTLRDAGMCLKHWQLFPLTGRSSAPGAVLCYLYNNYLTEIYIVRPCNKKCKIFVKSNGPCKASAGYNMLYLLHLHSGSSLTSTTTAPFAVVRAAIYSDRLTVEGWKGRKGENRETRSKKETLSVSQEVLPAVWAYSSMAKGEFRVTWSSPYYML